MMTETIVVADLDPKELTLLAKLVVRAEEEGGYLHVEVRKEVQHGEITVGYSERSSDR